MKNYLKPNDFIFSINEIFPLVFFQVSKIN